MKTKVNFRKATGRIKPMHAVGQPPMSQLCDDLMHYMTEAGIPYSRLHDTQGLMGSGLYVDIPNIFRNFDADPNDPAAYDFAFTDEFIRIMYKYRLTPFYRLGVTIENYFNIRTYHVLPPKDFQKWAEICEHIIRHYNQGWNSGFEYDMKYWEIWNEPDGSYFNKLNPTWQGTPQEFCRFYATAATHLKKCFGDSVRIGGYGAVGFYEYETIDPECIGYPGKPETVLQGHIKFVHEFLAYVRDHHAPLDFFSWHSYADVRKTLDMNAYMRRMLAKYGFQDVPDFLDEWNNCYNYETRHTGKPAALALGMMLAMQKTGTAMLNYYDARIGQSKYGGLFNPGNWTPYLTYYSFVSFNELYRLKQEVETETDDVDLQVGAAADGHEKIMVLANMKEEEISFSLEIQGADPTEADFILTNDQFTHAPVPSMLKDGRCTLPAYSCLEIHFHDKD